METGTLDHREQAVGLMRDAARTVRSVTASALEEVKAVHAAANALHALEAVLLAEIDATKAHEADGAASVGTWAARELLQDPATTKQLIRNAQTMRDLPSFGEAHRAGVISADHVNAMTYGIKHVGHHDTVDLEEDFLVVASQKTPREVFELMRTCKAIKHADDLDEAWLRGMEKRDFRCLRVGDGYVPQGLLPIEAGAKLKAYLDAKSVPTGPDDERTAAQRRCDALDELVTDKLNSGDLPSHNSVSPHLHVTVQAETLKDALNQSVVEVGGRQADPRNHNLLDAEPAVLEGFGPIGPALLAYIAFGGELTPILVAGFKANRTVLDVGRSSRVATKKQRAAIRYRQNGRCANRGCHHPIGEVHHVLDWLYGGKTKLTNLVGLCRKCHALITLGRLHMTGTYETGYTFTTTRAGPGGTSRLRGIARTG